jgi:hypothetical protein
MSRLLLIALLLSAALLAACGGSGDSGDSGDGARDEREAPASGTAGGGNSFVTAGDELCGRLAKRYPGARADRLEQSPAAGLKAASSFREYTRELNAGLKRQTAPDDADARQILVMTERLAAAALSHKVRHQRVVAAQQSDGPQAAFRAALEAVKGQRRMVSDVARPLDKRMRAYGFKVCGRTASAAPAKG